MHVGVSTGPSRLRRIQARVALRRSSMSVLAQNVLPLQNIMHHPDFDIAKVVVVVTLVWCVCVCVCLYGNIVRWSLVLHDLQQCHLNQTHF